MKTEPVGYATTSYDRRVAKTPRIPFKNRFLEQNPILSDRPVAALSRPALRKWLEVGSGPIRSTFSASGLFQDVLFVVSDVFLHTVTPSGTKALIGQLGIDPFGDVSWAAAANVGDTPARLFFAEGQILWLYTSNGEASGQLQVTSFANGDVIRIDSVYYKMTTGSVDAGTPDGTAGNPWLVAMIGVTSAQLYNLYKAIGDTGVTGTDYSTALVEHPTVAPNRIGLADLFVNARAYGPAGNGIVTTETGANMAWNAGTLGGGGLGQLRQVPMPDDVGAVSVAFINGYVIVVPVQEEALFTVGRFWWIDPGERFVDPLNFATAERSSDAVHQVGVYGNMFWLFGSITTEPWVTTGDPDAPMQRFQSILFDRGSWEGTAVQVKDSLIVVDENGGVFQISGQQKRISRPDIEERIRRAMEIESLNVS